MKKITAIICLAVLILAAFSSCEKAPDFVPMDADSIETVDWASGNRKDINKEEYYPLLAEAYNSVTGTGEYKDGNPEWTVVVSCKEEENLNSLYMISYLGEDTFNVSINGKAGIEEGQTRYSVENPDLAAFAREKLLTVENYSVTVTVKFVISAGIADEDGTVRAEDEILDVSEQVVSGNEIDPPTVSDAELQALVGGNFATDRKLSGDGKRVGGLNGYDEKSVQGDDSVDIYYWDSFLNGEKLPEAAVATTVISDGDEITVMYTVSHP